MIGSSATDGGIAQGSPVNSVGREWLKNADWDPQKNGFGIEFGAKYIDRLT
jgi:hypothetical protein